MAQLFDLYDRLGSLGLVESEAAHLGRRSKRHETSSGRRTGGGLFTKGQLHYLLTNPTYIGMVRHKDRTYPGQHPVIVSRDVWDRVQTKLLAAKARPRSGTAGARAVAIDGLHAQAHTSSSEPSSAPSSLRTAGLSAPLLGKLFDETGDGLTPTRTSTKGAATATTSRTG